MNFIMYFFLFIMIKLNEMMFVTTYKYQNVNTRLNKMCHSIIMTWFKKIKELYTFY